VGMLAERWQLPHGFLVLNRTKSPSHDESALMWSICYHEGLSERIVRLSWSSRCRKKNVTHQTACIVTSSTAGNAMFAGVNAVVHMPMVRAGGNMEGGVGVVVVVARSPLNAACPPLNIRIMVVLLVFHIASDPYLSPCYQRRKAHSLLETTISPLQPCSCRTRWIDAR
jgi:hypothetical protein